MSENVKELLFIFDGCTDESENVVLDALCNKSNKYNVKFFEKPEEEWEVKSCNTGFRNSSCRYSLNIQSDQLILEHEFDKHLLKPFHQIPDLMGVSARDAVDCGIDENGKLRFFNVFGSDVSSPRNILGVRQIVNRGPLLLDNLKLQDMNYLDEDFAPLDQDDTDLFLRGISKGYMSGAFMINYISPSNWGNKRKATGEKKKLIEETELKHCAMIVERHRDLLLNEKKDEDIIIK
jgi:hypothetical protein